MMLIVQFLSIFLLGLVTGVSLSHLLQRGPKKALTPPQFLAVQQILLRNYGPAIGGLELAALLATAVMTLLSWHEPMARMVSFFASVCVLTMIMICLDQPNQSNSQFMDA